MPEFLELALNSPSIVAEIDRKKAGINESGVSLTHQKLGQIKIPVPSIDDQQQIITEVAEKLSQIEAAEVAIDHSLRRAARLRQSILKQAFEGKLVPQDPTDEPASSLLARIKQDEVRGPTETKRARAKRPN